VEQQRLAEPDAQALARARKENGGKGEPEKEDDICGGV
jgi:hypothetical protein